MRGRGVTQRDHRLADDGRRGHDADRDRRRLPRLQREHGPAVRARLPGLGRDPERRPADQQQRGPDRRPPGRRGRVDRRDPGAAGGPRPPRRAADSEAAGDDRRRGRAAQPEARQDGRAAAARTRSSGSATGRRSGSSTWRSSAARASRRRRASSSTASTTRPTGRPPATCPATRASPAHRDGRERLLPAADRVRRDRQHLRHRDAHQRAHEPGRVRQRVRRPRHLAQRRDRQPRAAVPRPAAGRPRTLPQPETRFAASSPSSATPPRIVAPVAEQQADFFTKAAIAFAAISSDPAALQDDDLRGRADAGDRDRRCCRASARSCASSRSSRRELRPGVTRPAGDAAGAQRGDRGRHAGAAPLAGDQPAARGALRALNRLVSQPTTRVALQRLEETFDVGRSRSPSGWCRRRPSATTGTTGSPTCPNGALRPRPGRLRLPPGRSAEFPVRAEVRPARRLLRHAGRTAAQSPRRRGGKFEPYALPILNAHPYAPTGQQERRLPGRPVRLRARRGPGPRPAARQPRLRGLRPARLARPDDAVLPTTPASASCTTRGRLAPARDLEGGR